MCPEAFQLETALGTTPTKDATLVVPSNAAISSETERTMADLYSECLNMSSIQKFNMENSGNMNFYAVVQYDRNDIIDRLDLLAVAFGLKQAQLAEYAGVSTTSWSNYRSRAEGKETLPWYAAVNLRDSLNITTDWLYAGDLSSIRNDEVRRKIIMAQRRLSPRRRA
jgi:hypothetical protein